MRAILTLSVGASVLDYVAAQNSVPGMIQWQIEKRVKLPPSGQPLHKRGQTYEEVITNERSRGGYFTTCALGTPWQNISLQLDTGSSDIWVPDQTASACSVSRQNPTGCDLGTFNPNKSSTYQDVGRDEFNIQYVDGSHATGDYFTDRFEIGGAHVQNVTMGLGIDTDIAYGLVGVGYALNEAIVGGTQSAASAYPNLPVVLQEEGLINSVAYSLWLNDLDANTGAILFGGIDTGKYQGNLTRIQMYQSSQTRAYTAFIVALTGLQAVSSSGSDTLTSRSFPLAAVLDSGTTLSYLPLDLAQQVWEEAGAIYASEVDLALIPCSRSTSGGHFAFQFAGQDGPIIRVGMDELVLPLTSGQAPTFNSGPYAGQEACEFGIQNITGTYLLGDTFLRSAYVVYDLINNEVGIAATDFNSTNTNLVSFASLGATIPSATLAPNQAQATIAPAYTTPAFNAQQGFGETAKPSGTGTGTSGSSGKGDENAAIRIRTPPFNASALLVKMVSVVFAVVGSSLFLP
ncbi:hypothetical protein DL546_004468 [Coniochaeta pulveracea]|uniref:Probable aspartic-type endopeptidase OPSB n=1 Tax=Coniochaeta pulveracea TaxID=177199 RepID=A0A420YKU7_9PEZI|nr:hypothetical protein DL546_004468 [Coniochaeta pulveracea]